MVHWVNTLILNNINEIFSWIESIQLMNCFSAQSVFDDIGLYNIENQEYSWLPSWRMEQFLMAPYPKWIVADSSIIIPYSLYICKDCYCLFGLKTEKINTALRHFGHNHILGLGYRNFNFMNLFHFCLFVIIQHSSP